MNKAILTALLLGSALVACDEPKPETPPAPEAAAPAALAPSAAPTPSEVATVPPPVPMIVKKKASDCKNSATAADFSDDPALEKEVRRKLGKDQGTITPGDLARVKSINLSNEKTRQINPCVFPLMTGLKGAFFGQGEYDDLTPIQKLTTLEELVASQNVIKDLHPIEGLKRLDRLDLSHTLIDDDALKAVGNLINVTELTLDEDAITDLTPISNLKKLQKLSIKKTRVQNLAPLAGIHTLKALYIAESQVSDISPVQPLMSGGMKLFQN